MTVVLGIDPGSRVTGFGVIRTDGARQHYLASGCIRTRSAGLPGRLGEIHKQIGEVIDAWPPDEVAIEEVFVSRNANTALVLGQARGAAIAAVVSRDLPLFEYAARRVKQAVHGKGNALKEQVAIMVQRQLGLSGQPQPDAADALAVALCHAFIQHGIGRRAAIEHVQHRRMLPGDGS